MAASGKRDTDKCPLCGASNESNGHLKAHCPEDSVKRIRGRMVSAIAELVQNELGDSMPDPAWQAIADQWNEKSLKEAYPEEGRHSLVGIKCKNCRKGHNCRHRGKTGHLPATETADAAEDTDPEEAHDELDMVDEHVRRYITDMRKPGARTTWAGWFPKSFAQLGDVRGHARKALCSRLLDILKPEDAKTGPAGPPGALALSIGGGAKNPKKTFILRLLPLSP